MRPKPEQVRNDIGETVKSLLDADFAHVLFAHGDPIVGDGHQALEEFARLLP